MFVIWTVFFVWGIYAALPTIYYKYLRKTKRIDERKISLTFDDGPDEIYTQLLLMLLQKHKIKATFFLVAEKAMQHPQIVEKIKAAGHEIGLHCDRHHKALYQLPHQTIRDIDAGVEKLRELGIEPKFYRPPHGYINLAMLWKIKSAGLQLMLWDILPRDWREDKTFDEICYILLRETKNGGVICLHDSGKGTGGNLHSPRNTIAALERFIPMMEMRGYWFEW